MPGIFVNTRPWNLQVSVQDFKKMSRGVVHWNPVSTTPHFLKTSREFHQKLSLFAEKDFTTLAFPEKIYHYPQQNK